MYKRLEELLPWAYQRQEVPAVAYALPALILPAATPPSPAAQQATPAPMVAPGPEVVQ